MQFKLRAFFGAIAGTLPGMAAVALLPAASEAGGFLTGLGFSGVQWLWPLAIPPVAAIVAFWATRAAAFRMLREVQEGLEQVLVEERAVAGIAKRDCALTCL